MPVYAPAYRSIEIDIARSSPRWLIIVDYELRLAWRSWLVRILVFLNLGWFGYSTIQFAGYDLIMQDESHLLRPLLLQWNWLHVNARAVFDFLRIQSPAVFLLIVYVGSGMVCNDSRNNLHSIYFSRPVTWRNYFAGKFGALVSIGLLSSALPCLLLIGLHLLMSPTQETFQASWWWPLSALAFATLNVTSYASATLLCSVLIRSQGLASIAVLALYIATGAFGALLSELTGQPNFLVVSFAMALNRVGQHWFGDPVQFFHLHYGWALLYALLIVCLSLFIIGMRLRRVERGT